MVWDICNIVLHGGSNGVYYTNDIITGSVILEFKKERKIEKIYLKVTGISKASWSRPSPTLPYVKIYSQTKRVLDISIEVFKELEGKTVKPGIVSSQIHFILPSDLPPTYRDSVAKVYYRIEMYSINAWKIKSKRAISFIVKNHLNINDNHEFKIPMVYELEKKIGNSKFLLTFKTYRGFASSQRIPFEVIITNEKRIKVKRITVSLIQKIEYNVTSGFYHDEKTICIINFNEILNLVTQNCMLSMEIPDILPSTVTQNEPMIEFSYSLQVKVSFRFHLPLISTIPVTVASTPVTHVIIFK